MKQVQHAALLGSASRDRGTAAAIEHVLGELGFTRNEQPPMVAGWPRATETSLDLVYLSPERGAWAALGTSPNLARAIAVRVAARVKLTLQLFTATARFDDRSLECTIEDRMIRTDGATALGGFSRELEASVGGDWKDMCDAKPYFAIDSLLDAAVEAWIPSAFERRAAAWVPPPSLGDRRLDELALRIRTAVRAELTTIDGRACVRVTTFDNASTMSFLTPEELAILQPAVAGLLAT